MSGFKRFKDEPANDDTGPQLLNCSFCQAVTAKATLGTYGARCFRCYEAYCRAPQRVPTWMADKRSDGMKAWADALRAQEASGVRLTTAQRDMWRSALGPQEQAA